MKNNNSFVYPINDEIILKESIFKVGKITSVEGRFVKITVDKNKNTSYLIYKGELLKNISVGGYIKIVKGFIKIIGKIEGEYITEDKIVPQKESQSAFLKNHYKNKGEYKDEKEKINRVLNVSLLGFFGDKGFERGIKELPLIDNECFLLEKKEFNTVHNFVKDNDESITIGSLSLEKGQPIKVGINSLFTGHIGIFGNTGSGKSYTLAKIYRELFKKYKEIESFKTNGMFFLFDFNGEYSEDKIIIENKKIYNLTTRKEVKSIQDNEKFPLNENDLIDIELISILANATEKTQKPFINRSLNFYKKIISNDNSLEFFKNNIKKRIKDILKMPDKDKAYMLIDYLISILENENSNLNESFFSEIDWNNKNNHFMKKGGLCKVLEDNEIEEICLYKEVNNYDFPKNILSKIIHFLYLQIIFDVYNDKAHNEHIAPAINKLKSKREDIEKVLNTENNKSNIFSENNIIILNLRDVNLEMKKTLPLLLSKKIYSEHKKAYNKNQEKFLNIIIDEAHNILSKESFREAESWKDYRLETFEEIIKEGRKFGVFLTIASQRPHDISPTIISQLHNYFLHRLINNHDIKAVEKTIAYLDRVSFDSLPILPTGTCIVAGLFAQVPVIVDIGKIKLDHEPDNKTIDLIKNWKNGHKNIKNKDNSTDNSIKEDKNV